MPSLTNVLNWINSRAYDGRDAYSAEFVMMDEDITLASIAGDKATHWPYSVDENPLLSIEDAYAYFMDTYYDYLSDAGFNASRDGPYYIDITNEHGSTIHCQEMRESILPYIKEVFERFVMEFECEAAFKSPMDAFDLKDGRWEIVPHSERQTFTEYSWFDSSLYDIVTGDHPDAAYYTGTHGHVGQNYCPTLFPYSILMEPPCQA